MCFSCGNVTYIEGSKKFQRKKLEHSGDKKIIKKKSLLKTAIANNNQQSTSKLSIFQFGKLMNRK